MLYLTVPYKDYELVNNMGALFDNRFKKWFVVRREDYKKFAEWIDPNADCIIYDHFWIAGQELICESCCNNINMVAFAVKSFTLINRDDGFINFGHVFNNEIHISGILSPMLPSILHWINNASFSYHLLTNRYGDKEYLNCCPRCNATQNSFNLFHEPGGFGLTTEYNAEKDAKEITFFEVPLNGIDIAVNINFSFGELDTLYEKFSKFKEQACQFPLGEYLGSFRKV